MLAEYLKANCPGFNYEVIMKIKNEWPPFVAALTRSYGFNKICCPIVFTVEGTLIGDTQDFHMYAKTQYNKSYTVSKEIL